MVDTPADAEGWITLGTPESIFAGRSCRPLRLEGAQVGLFRVEGEIFAIDDICSHGNARLTDGDMEGFEVECPLHAGVFDIRSGKALSAPLTRDVRSHDVEVRGGQLCIRLQR